MPPSHNVKPDILPPVPEDAMGMCKYPCRRCGSDIPIERHHTATINRMIRKETNLAYEPDLELHYRCQYWLRRVCSACAANSEYQARWKWRRWIDELPVRYVQEYGDILRELVERTKPHWHYISQLDIAGQAHEDVDDDEVLSKLIVTVLPEWAAVVKERSNV